MAVFPAMLAVTLLATDRAPLQAQSADDAAADLLERLRAYASQYIETMASVVAHERYTQSLTARRTAPRTTELKSDVLMLRLPGSQHTVWFRDVYEADGRKVRDREQRLFRLLESTASGRLDDLRRIAAESARFNLGQVPRTTNVPDLVFAYLVAPAGHVKLTWRGEGKVNGQRARVLRLEEAGSPTIVRSPSGRDAQARGRVWVSPDTAAVLRSEVILGDVTTSTTTTVEFAEHPRIAVRVPARMEESYKTPGELGSGIATYSEVRVFGVATSEQVKKPPPGRH